MKKQFNSMKWEVMGVVLSLTLIITGIMSFMLLNIHTKSLVNEVELRGISTARNIANNIADFIMMRHELEAAKVLKEAMQNKGVIYAMVVGSNGVILAHNDMTQVKKKYMPPGKIIKTTAAKNVIFETKSGGRLIEFTAAAVAKHKARTGVVRVAVSYDLISRALKQTYINIALVTVIAVILSVIGAFFLSTAITKPINILAQGVKIAGSGDLNHKIAIKSKNELGLLADAFNEMTDDLKRAQKTALEKLAMEKELEIASRLQDSLLPKKFPDMGKYEASAFYKPAKEIGGDYYDVIPLAGGRFGIVMADVSGKGVPAALIMTMLRGVLNTEAVLNSDPVRVLINLNNGLLGRVEGNIFATIFYAVLDTAGGLVEMASAGHHEILVYKSGAGAVESYCPKGAAIGILKGNNFEARLEKITVKIETGDRLLLFTDGISEAKSKSGGRFGMERAVKSLQKNGGRACREIIDGLLYDVDVFTDKEEQSDDIAVLSVGRTA